MTESVLSLPVKYCCVFLGQQIISRSSEYRYFKHSKTLFTARYYGSSLLISLLSFCWNLYYEFLSLASLCNIPVPPPSTKFADDMPQDTWSGLCHAYFSECFVTSAVCKEFTHRYLYSSCSQLFKNSIHQLCARKRFVLEFVMEFDLLIQRFGIWYCHQ